MFLTVDFEDRRPLYQQIVDGIKAVIASGELREGTSLPPLRQLAADLNVNLNTIAVAYRQLQEEGLLTIRHGSGAVIASRRARDAGEGEIRKSLRNVLAQWILAGRTDREIRRAVSRELTSLHRKGASL